MAAALHLGVPRVPPARSGAEHHHQPHTYHHHDYDSDYEHDDERAPPSPSSSSRRLSPNFNNHQTTAKPAKQPVINSILESLDTLTSPHSPQLDEPTTPDSADDAYTVRSYTSLAGSVSPGFGVEYNTGLSLDDEDGLSNAALPPTVRTSRPPSGWSNYSRPRTPTSPGARRDPMHKTSSIRSRHSFSPTSRDKGGFHNSRLSAESWVKQNSRSRESVDTSVSRRSRRSLRRKNSRESLKPIEDMATSVDDWAAESPVVSRTTQMHATNETPPTSNSKKRLYITEKGSYEEQPVFEAPPAVEEAPMVDESSRALPRKAVEEESRNRSSSRESSIINSVPTRTSSLRLSLSPNRKKKKDKKAKRQSEKREASLKEESVEEIKIDSVMNSTPTPNPQSSWADLGEDDGTVKRIRQLQEQRKSRLIESQDVLANGALDSPPRGQNDGKKRPTSLKPAANRAVSEPPVKAHKLLGLPTEQNGQDINGNPHLPGFIERRDMTLDEQKLQVRPTTKSSEPPSSPLTLDYSYAEAMDALHGIEREPKREAPPVPEKSTTREQLSLSAQYPGTQINAVSKQSKSKYPSALRMYTSKSDRRKTVHPDLPLAYEMKKSRRKSMGDARNPRHEDDSQVPAVPTAPRNSTEIAVDEYLRDGRLNRKIRHPITGRIISFSEVGDPNGGAVFVCVGMGLTRYVTAFYDELATTLRLRLITIDRPGVGGSEPYPPTDRSGPLNWPDDVLAICQSLNITKFSMLAHSAGAIYSLAAALILPQMVQGKVHLLAPWIPPSQLHTISHHAASTPPAGALPRSQRLLRMLPAPFLKAANSSFMTATSTSLKPVNTKTKVNTGKPVAVQNPPPNGRSATRDGASGPATDLQNRRESMMMMDQYVPGLDPTDDFPLQQPQAAMSATASPTDPSLEFAASALDAAEHRKLEFASLLTQRTWDLAVRDSNPATDLLVCLERHRDVGFRYTDVLRELVVTHGAEDKRVPLANVRWLAEEMNRRRTTFTADDDGDDGDGYARAGCELRVLEGEGHGLMASPRIMGDVLTEIAGYWPR